MHNLIFYTSSSAMVLQSHLYEHVALAPSPRNLIWCPLEASVSELVLFSPYNSILNEQKERKEG